MPERNTRQKAAVLEVLEQAKTPLATPQVLAKAQALGADDQPGNGVPDPQVLLSKDVIATVQLPGEVPLYELAGKSHHHDFRCRRCGFMYEVDGCTDMLKELVPRGFRLEDHELFLFGTCSTCTKRK